MILSIYVNNFLAYGSETEFSLLPDARIKKFDSNIYRENGFSVLKSVCIYGPNNVGKTCIIRAIDTIRDVLLGQNTNFSANLYSGSEICSLGIKFLSGGKAYSYSFRYDLSETDGYRRGFIFERFSEILKNGEEKEIFIRDMEGGVYRFAGNDEITALMKLVSSNNILIYTVNVDNYPELKRCHSLLREFADRIFVLSIDNIPIDKTIQVLKNNTKFREKVVELIKLSDLDIDDYKYNSTNREANLKPRESALNTPSYMEDMIKLTSVHKGKSVQSLLYDSTGTKKMVAFASYIVEALTERKILVVDELDSSLHFKLTRAIVSLFNNELSLAQLIFSAHDLSLLDCKRLFRKDQIRFADKTETGARLYSLSDISDDKTDDVMESYRAGAFGALPQPELISLLLKETEDE